MPLTKLLICMFLIVTLFLKDMSTPIVTAFPIAVPSIVKAAPSTTMLSFSTVMLPTRVSRRV